jgi:tyrosyl-DNA phosphodiesterase 1
MKTQSATQAKQVAYMSPYLCHWASDVGGSSSKTDKSSPVVRQAGRNRAAPHIKTYVRFTDSSMNRIDWAMVTSANLSTQAWGAAPNASGEVRICSWEIGVVVWPELWKGRGGSPKDFKIVDMVPVFGQDTPSIGPSDSERRRVVGFRMPYDLPLAPYAKSSMPWCATSSYTEPDWRGMTYNTGGG